MHIIFLGKYFLKSIAFLKDNKSWVTKMGSGGKLGYPRSLNGSGGLQSAYRLVEQSQGVL